MGRQLRGGYGRCTPQSFVARADADLIAGVRLAELIRDDLEELARALGAEVTAMAPVGNDLARWPPRSART